MKDSTTVAVLLGQRVREMRTKRKLTQQALAETAGIPQTHVSAIELGQMSPSLITLVRLAVALDCKVAKLVSILDERGLASLLPK